MVALCLPITPVYFTGSLRRFMLISLLLEQVQQHENEYVVTLIKPSTRSLRTALIILHPTKTMAVHVQELHTSSGMLFLGTVAHTVTAPDAARSVEDLYGITSCPRAGNTWAKTVVRCILYFSISTVMLKCGVCIWDSLSLMLNLLKTKA